MRKLRFWETWDWKSIREGILLLCFMIATFLFLEKYPDFVRNGKSSHLNQNVKGQFISIKPIEGLYESAYRGNLTTQNYFAVAYSYEVEGRTYYNEDRIPNSFTNKSFIETLTKGELKQVTVRYNSFEPSKSQIAVDN